ncbi:pyridine nucleotide-disulfide oxidoreductase-domain-containing protein [Cercophora newfieldiana]|uniref:Pyridine nucleotide-disulfide oxidoreductase-domain-containing protein n=1 Tax=Cercophora newfieldiana TaxID=92897 RepID=A0AA39YPF0_9PEZI|nr:pyridine nucleotide-disulfide oxidoreductase-domain-containing protein [Cercophora newfieldiana]
MQPLMSRAVIRILAQAKRGQSSTRYSFLIARRYAHQDAAPTTQTPLSAAAIVVGGGPAGIAVVGNLLENLPKSNGSIAWIDRAGFNGGRVSKYREVPSNTTTELFIKYAQELEPFREICDAARSANGEKSAIGTLESFPRTATCKLTFAADMLSELSRGLSDNNRVTRIDGDAVGLRWDTENSRWELTYGAWMGKKAEMLERLVASPMIVFCTGSKAKTLPLPEGVARIPLVTALTPTELKKTLSSKPGPTVVGVVGGSHSAILVLKNLAELAQTSHPDLKILWLTRSGLKYAVPQGDWILYDNTGLKGEAADFARNNLDGDNLTTGPLKDIVTRIDSSGLTHEETRNALYGCDFAVQAIGFEPRPFGRSRSWPRFDNTTGRFQARKKDQEEMANIRGMFGAGVAFPERVVDPAGNVEHAVGFWKFMRFLKRVVPDWVASSTAEAPRQIGEDCVETGVFSKDPSKRLIFSPQPEGYAMERIRKVVPVDPRLSENTREIIRKTHNAVRNSLDVTSKFRQAVMMGASSDETQTSKLEKSDSTLYWRRRLRKLESSIHALLGDIYKIKAQSHYPKGPAKKTNRPKKPTVRRVVKGANSVGSEPEVHELRADDGSKAISEN